MQKVKLGWLIGLFLILIWAPELVAHNVSTKSAPLHPISPTQRDQLVRQIADSLDRRYVYPEIARQIQQKLLSNLAAGIYHGISDGVTLAQTLHADALAISQDKHMAVQHMSEVVARRADRQQKNAHFSYEYLQENVGYLKFNEFRQTPDAFKQMEVAMAALVNSKVLIIDLRENGGGSPQMVEFLASYFFTQPTLLNTFYNRQGRITGRVKTYGQDLSAHYAEKTDLYILTSKHTFSAAEGFSYHLQAAQKATIVGEVTGGGAHPITRQLLPSDIRLTIPIIRAHNPMTQSNWEGTGVRPDLEVEADKALETVLNRLEKKATVG